MVASMLSRMVTRLAMGFLQRHFSPLAGIDVPRGAVDVGDFPPTLIPDRPGMVLHPAGVAGFGDDPILHPEGLGRP